MSELRFKFGKFFIILGALSLLLFAFSMIADSANFYLIITGILLILFGTILRKKTKIKESEPAVSDSKRNRRGKYHNSRFKDQDEQEDRQSRRSRRS
jgi:hypothetical protein